MPIRDAAAEYPGIVLTAMLETSDFAKQAIPIPTVAHNALVAAR
jgi:hypothetical protein